MLILGFFGAAGALAFALFSAFGLAGALIAAAFGFSWCFSFSRCFSLYRLTSRTFSSINYQQVLGSFLLLNELA
jgi:hypothetical protein